MRSPRGVSPVATLQGSQVTLRGVSIAALCRKRGASGRSHWRPRPVGRPRMGLGIPMCLLRVTRSCRSAPHDLWRERNTPGDARGTAPMRHSHSDDEAGHGESCRSSWRGRSTHLAGLVPAKPTVACGAIGVVLRSASPGDETASLVPALAPSHQGSAEDQGPLALAARDPQAHLPPGTAQPPPLGAHASSH